jgi:hypothetical protein
MKTMPTNRPDVPVPTMAPQPAPQAGMPTPLPQHLHPVGVNSGELGLPWHHTFNGGGPQNAVHPMPAQGNPLKKPTMGVEPNQGLAGGVGWAGGNMPGIGFL